MRRLAIAATVVAVLVAAGTAEAAYTFNVYPSGDPNLVVVTPHILASDSGWSNSGVSYAQNGYVHADFTMPSTMLADKLYFQSADMHTNGWFTAELYVNGGLQASEVMYDIDASYTLVDIEWDLGPGVSLTAGDAVQLKLIYGFKMSTSSSTAVRIAQWDNGGPNAYGAALTGVFDDQNGYAPMALLPFTPPVPEPAGLGLIGVALLAIRKRRAQ